MEFFAILWMLLIGLVVGAIARLLIPGRQPIGIALTMVLGVVGSFVGGLISWAYYGAPAGGYEPAGFLMSILGAALVLGGYVAMTRNRVTT